MTLPTKKEVLVVLANNDYLEGAKQVFSSAYFNGGWKGDMLLLVKNGSIDEFDLVPFKNKGILIKEVDSFYEDVKQEYAKDQISLCKIFIFQPYFKKWSRVLYLDADVIVRYSLENIFRWDKFSAVSSFWNSQMDHKFNRYREPSLYQIAKKEFRTEARVFNSGVMAFPTNIIKNETFQEIKSNFFKYKKILYGGDEALINFYFNKKKWKPLPGVYNVFVNEILYMRLFPVYLIDGVILHFTGASKPWNIEHPFYFEWKVNLDKFSQIKKQPSGYKTKMMIVNRVILSMLSFCYFLFRIFLRRFPNLDLKHR